MQNTQLEFDLNLIIKECVIGNNQFKCLSKSQCFAQTLTMKLSFSIWSLSEQDDEHTVSNLFFLRSLNDNISLLFKTLQNCSGSDYYGTFKC